MGKEKGGREVYLLTNIHDKLLNEKKKKVTEQLIQYGPNFVKNILGK